MSPTVVQRRDPPRCDSDLAAAIGPGPWLVVAPHDDDAVLGLGATIAAATAAGIAVHVAVLTDGAMGYDQPEDAPALVATRAGELRAALADLGVGAAAVHELGFADGQLQRERGCRPDAQGGGLGRRLVTVLRQVRPGTVFVCTAADLHPDHQAATPETAMACCWAASPIWRELGPPIDAPREWHYAVYCAFPTPPEVQIAAAPAAFAAKLRSLRRFVSQPFIAAMITRLEADGPYEHLAAATWSPYRPALYRDRFAGEPGPCSADFAEDCAASVALVRAFRPWPALTKALAAPLTLVGEGSSRLFVAGFARHLARRLGVALSLDACGGRVAGAGPHLWCSNSGATRELVEAAQRASLPGDLALLGRDGGPLARLISERRVVLTAPERAVAATASVLLQALTVGAAVAERAGQAPPLAALAEAIARTLAAAPDPAAVAAIAGAQRVWWCDDECGLADELALKTMEIPGLPGLALPGTLGLHGPEEVFGPGDVIAGLRPYADDLALRERVVASTGVRIVDLEAALPITDLGPWTPLVALAAGWRLLAAAAVARGRDPARPLRARKVGNPATGI